MNMSCLSQAKSVVDRLLKDSKQKALRKITRKRSSSLISFISRPIVCLLLCLKLLKVVEKLSYQHFVFVSTTSSMGLEEVASTTSNIKGKLLINLLYLKQFFAGRISSTISSCGNVFTKGLFVGELAGFHSSVCGGASMKLSSASFSSPLLLLLGLEMCRFLIVSKEINSFFGTVKVNSHYHCFKEKTCVSLDSG